MNNGFIFTARFCFVLVTGRHSFLHFTTICFSEERDVLNLPATKVNAHHKTAAGKQHQKGECCR